MKIAIFGNIFKGPALINELNVVINFFQKRHIEILLSQEIRRELNLMEFESFDSEKADIGSIDFALSIGGDGTFLTTVADIGSCSIPILGINLGHLGFLADAQTNDIQGILEQLIRSEYTIEQRSMLRVTCSAGATILAPNALNEIAISKQGLGSMIEIETVVNGQLLHTYSADGLVIATPTGSTAYNLSIGGPIMVPQTKAIILSPVASHSLTVRPIAIPDDWAIDIRVKSRNGNYMVSVDGRSQILADDILLHIEKSPETVKLVQIGENNFIQSLKNKLLWGAN